MSETFSTRGLKALFSYPFRQPGWEGKMAILAGLYLGGFILPVLPWLAAAGYSAELLRRVAEGQGEPELPEWKDWSKFFIEGLRLCGASLIASIPLGLVMACGFIPYFLSVFGAMGIDASGGDSSIFAPFVMGSSFLMMFSMFCGFVLGLAVGVPFPAAVAHMLVRRSFGALFEVRAWGRILRANLGGFILAFLLLFAASFALQMASQFLVYSFILCAVGVLLPLIFGPYLSILGAYLFGQAYREGMETLRLADAPVELTDEEINPPAEPDVQAE